MKDQYLKQLKKHVIEKIRHYESVEDEMSGALSAYYEMLHLIQVMLGEV